MSGNKNAIVQMVIREAEKQGVDPKVALAYVGIESSFDPKRVSPYGGKYKGLFQMSHNEFNSNGGKGNIFNPQQNIKAGIAKMKKDMAWFEAKTGRKPGAAEMYLTHQRGRGGVINHYNMDPNAKAWQAMYNTGEGRQRGVGWAKLTVEGNVTPQMIQKYGSRKAAAENMTNAEFVNHWTNRVNRELAKWGGEGTPLPFGGLAPTEKDIGNALPVMSPRARNKAVEIETADHYFSPNGEVNPFAPDRGPSAAPAPARGVRESTDLGQAGHESGPGRFAPLPPSSDGGPINPFDPGIGKVAAMSPEFNQGRHPLAPIQPEFATGSTGEEQAAQEDVNKLQDLARTQHDLAMNQVEQPDAYTANSPSLQTGSTGGGGYISDPGFEEPLSAWPQMLGPGKASNSAPRAQQAPTVSLSVSPGFAPRNTFNLDAINKLVAAARKFGV